MWKVRRQASVETELNRANNKIIQVMRHTDNQNLLKLTCQVHLVKLQFNDSWTELWNWAD